MTSFIFSHNQIQIPLLQHFHGAKADFNLVKKIENHKKNDAIEVEHHAWYNSDKS